MVFFFPLSTFTWFSTCLSPVWHAEAAMVDLASAPLLAKTVYLVQAWLKKQISCPFPVHVYSVFVLFWYCAIPIFARLQSYEGKLWKMQGLFDGRWSRDNIMASLELSLRCQARRSVAIFFSFLFFPKLAFKTSGGHHSTVYSLSQNKYMPWD